MALHLTTLAVSLLLLLTAGRADAAPAYRITNLGVLPGDSVSVATDLNNHGEVVGTTGSASSGRAFIWRGGVMTELAPLPAESDNSAPYAINDHGQVIGQYRQVNGGSSAGFLWDSGTVSSIGLAFELNNAGQSVGASDTSPTQAMLWDGTTATVLGALPSTTGTVAWDINESGRVVGHGVRAGGSYTALLWENGNTTEIGDLAGGAYDSIAAGINDLGQVVGTGTVATSAGGSASHAFLWDRGVMTDLGDLPGGNDLSVGLDINNAGQVVGYSSADFIDHGFLWDLGTMFDLNMLIDDADPLKSVTEIRMAYSINDRGQIAGWAIIQGQGRAVLLSPVSSPLAVPEPKAWLLVFTGLGLLLPAALRRQRFG